MSKCTTGELAKLCGVTVRTVQHYDNWGILIPSEFSEGGRWQVIIATPEIDDQFQELFLMPVDDSAGYLFTCAAGGLRVKIVGHTMDHDSPSYDIGYPEPVCQHGKVCAPIRG